MIVRNGCAPKPHTAPRAAMTRGASSCQQSRSRTTEACRELRAVLALARRSDQTVGAQCQAQGRQAGSGKRQRRRVDIVRPSTANTKVRLPTAVVIAKVPPTIAVAKTKVRPDTATANTKVRPDTATMRTLG